MSTPRFKLTQLALAACLASSPLHAATYYWDNNDATNGFGTASGTWAAPTTNDSTQGWSTSTTGTVALSGTTTTTTADTVFFGYGTNGLGAGTVTISGTVGAVAEEHRVGGGRRRRAG